MKESGNIAHFDEGIVIGHDSGYGIKVGNYGDQARRWGYRDVVYPIVQRGAETDISPEAYSDPTWAAMGSTNFYGYKFAVNDYIWQPMFIPHDVVASESIYFKAVWSLGTISSPLETTFVTWLFDYAYSKGGNQAAADLGHATSPEVDSGLLYLTEQVPTALYKPMTTFSTAVTLTGLTEPGGCIMTRIGRVSNQTSPENEATEDVFLVGVGFSYKSSNMSTTAKSADYYAL